MKLTTENVEKVFRESLSENVCPSSVQIESVCLRAAFDPEKLKAKANDISSMLQDLPEAFREDCGGGWSFIEMCRTKEGNQWTDLQHRMDQLVALGLAIGKVQFCAPRTVWSKLPGGMPYIVIIG